MILKIKNVFSKAALPTIAMAIALSSNAAQAMDAPNFPDEAQLLIFKKGLTRKDLGHCAQVSRAWERVSSDDAIWENHAIEYSDSGKIFHINYNSSKAFESTNFPSWKNILRESYAHYSPDILKSHMPTFSQIKKSKIEAKRKMAKTFSNDTEQTFPEVSNPNFGTSVDGAGKSSIFVYF